MDVRMRWLSILLFAVFLASCTEDPIPFYYSGNPRLELTQDSIVVMGQNGEIPGIEAAHVRPDGQAFIAGYESMEDGTGMYGMVWKFNGIHWESAIDAVTRSSLLSVRALDGSDFGSLWAIGYRQPDSASVILRRDGTQWSDVSPGDLLPVRDCHVASDNNVWAWGGHYRLYHYTNAAWETFDLPVDSLGTDNLAVVSLVANDDVTYVLTYLYPSQDSTGRAILKYENDQWDIIYREGSIPGAGGANRTLRTLVLADHGELFAFGQIVYRWDGSSLIRVVSPNPPADLLTGTVGPSGNILVAGANTKAVWTNLRTWHNVHVESPMPVTFLDVGMNDSLVVLTGSHAVSVGENAYASEMVALRGILQRQEQ